MYESIVFCVGENQIEIGNRTFDLGVLTTECLNLPKAEYRSMRHLWEMAERHISCYKRERDLGEWRLANVLLTELDQMMGEYRFFRILRKNNDLLSEADRFLRAPDAESCALTSRDHEIMQQIIEYEEYLENPEDYGGSYESFVNDPKTGEEIPVSVPQRPIPPKPPEKTTALLILPGPIDVKWGYYVRFVQGYYSALLDVESFNNTMFFFIREFLSPLKKLDRGNYAAALADFLYGDFAYKRIAGPLNGRGFFSAADPVMLRYVPRETYPGSGEYRIYDYYEVQYLQTLLKTDFYRALDCGYVVRKCEYCGRYFLLKKGYKTKYCDQPNPDDPTHTCAQLGYVRLRRKEKAADDPKLQALHRCKGRIDKDYARAIIDDEERERLLARARELYYQATQDPSITFEMLDTSLASKSLYHDCEVIRDTNPRGRPRKMPGSLSE